MSAEREEVHDAEFSEPHKECSHAVRTTSGKCLQCGTYQTEEPSRALQTRTPADYVALAIERNLDIEKLRELMALEKEWRADKAKAEYAAAMVKFGQFKQVVAHNRTGRTAGNALFSYADFPTLVDAVTPWLAECELSFSHSQDDPVMEGKGIAYVMVHCHVRHSAGHTESRSFPAIPDLRLDGKVSPSQLIQLAITYAKRQTLSMALGIATAEDNADDDAQKHKQEKEKPQSVSEQLRQPRSEGPRKINKEEVDQLGAAARESGMPNAEGSKIVKAHGFETMARITIDKFPAILKALKEWQPAGETQDEEKPSADPSEVEQLRIKADELLSAVVDAGYKGNTKVLLKSACGERDLPKVAADKLPGLITRLEAELIGLRKLAN